MFGAATIEKNCILFRLYQNSRTENRQQKNKKENTFGFIIENVFVLNVKKLCNITLGTVSPYFTYKKRKCVRPQLMWGSSIPNRLFQDLEITFNFSHPCSSIFSLIFNVSILLHFRTLTFLSSPIPSPTTFHLLFIPPLFHSFI